MAFTLASNPPRELIFEWQGTNPQGQPVRGQMRAWGENQVMAMLRRQGVQNLQVMRQQPTAGVTIKPGDIALFTRQLATMLQAGVPLLQSFDALGRGHTNPRMARLLDVIRADVETGTALSAAFRRHPAHFNPLYCNLVAAGEAAGILDVLLDRLALHMEKTEAMKAQLRSALTYPAAVVLVALVVIAVIMIFVIPSFERVFSSFGAELPGPTLLVMRASAFFVDWWWLLLGLTGLGFYAFVTALRCSEKLQRFMDRFVLRLPVFGALIEKACIARWTRTLSTLFAAGLPLMDALDSVAGTTGNSVYALATAGIQKEVSSGVSLNSAMAHACLFPPMLVQMCMIGEESGSLDHMLGKAAGFFEGEVDQQVSALASLLEPFIIVTLGVLIGGIVVSMYLPIFQMGQVT
jgi:type IV pilus assembly protein PilC